jgi:hypothetical protein
VPSWRRDRSIGPRRDDHRRRVKPHRVLG